MARRPRQTEEKIEEVQEVKTQETEVEEAKNTETQAENVQEVEEVPVENAKETEEVVNDECQCGCDECNNECKHADLDDGPIAEVITTEVLKDGIKTILNSFPSTEFEFLTVKTRILEYLAKF